MKLKTFAIIWSIIYIGWGLGLLVNPVRLMAIYGLALDASGALMARIVGASLIGFGMTFWLNRSINSTEKGWYNLLSTSFIYNIISIPVTFMATLNGVMRSMGWIAVGLHIFLALTFGFFTLNKKRETTI
jgi:hypothetical protein